MGCNPTYFLISGNTLFLGGFVPIYLMDKKKLGTMLACTELSCRLGTIAVIQWHPTNCEPLQKSLKSGRAIQAKRGLVFPASERRKGQINCQAGLLADPSEGRGFIAKWQVQRP